MSIYGQRYQIGFGAGLTPMVKYLLIANVSMFVLQHIMPGIMGWFELRLSSVIENLAVWQFFTYMFLHGDVWHILINMIVLWFIGSELERYWGGREFLIFYAVCGVGAGIIHILLQLLVFQSAAGGVIGASGAVYGLLMAFGLLFPNRTITLLLMFVLPIQVKAKYLVMFLGGIAVLSGFFGGNDGVAHFAHLGGMLVGFLYLKLNWRWSSAGMKLRGLDQYSPGPTTARSTDLLSRVKGWFYKQSDSRRQMKVVRRRQEEMHLRERVDIILDKINEVGYDNLTEEERKTLQRASQILNQEQIRPHDYGPN